MEITKLKTIGGLERAASGGCGQRPAFNSLQPWLKVGKSRHARPPHEGVSGGLLSPKILLRGAEGPGEPCSWPCCCGASQRVPNLITVLSMPPQR